jgi:glyoxylase-like metal-dependent hydrolase (beta-lactamase superfamily II)
VTLFPLPGVTPGTCGLLLEDARFTVVLTGDAIPTIEHLERGQVPDDAVDLEKAQESFTDAVEVADMLVLGRDNLVVNPTKRPF